jgi:hypothetical protein
VWKLDFFQTFDDRSSCVFNRYFLQNWFNSYELNFLLILQVTNTWKRAFMHCKHNCLLANIFETETENWVLQKTKITSRMRSDEAEDQGSLGCISFFFSILNQFCRKYLLNTQLLRSSNVWKKSSFHTIPYSPFLLSKAQKILSPVE